jgi:hypothetical protein
MAKKLIRVKPAKWLEDDMYINYSKELNFAFIGPEEETNDKGFRVRTQVSKFVGCREILCKDYRAYAHDFSRESSQTRDGYKTDMETLRLLIAVMNTYLTEEESKKRVFAGKRALNLLEEYAGFETQSVITTVKHTNSRYPRCWLLTGANEWVSTPQLLSFATLVLRSSYHLEGGLNSDSLEELITQFKGFKLRDNEGVISDSVADNDLGRLRKISQHILRVLDIREKLFYQDIKKAYDPNSRFTDYGYGGIQALFDMATGQMELNKKFKNLVIKYKPESESEKNRELCK